MKKRVKDETTLIPHVYAIQKVPQQEDREDIAALMPTFTSMPSTYTHTFIVPSKESTYLC